MKGFFVAVALFALCVSSVYAGTIPSGRDAWPNYTLLKMVEDCDLVVTGEVTSMVAVFRPGITTDVTINIEDVIKGTPNAGADTVRFTQIGGDGVDPATGERVAMHMGPQADFEVGEDVLVFLNQKDETIGLNYPAGGYGKRKIEDNKTTILYPAIDDADEAKLVEMPVDLAVKLGKASLKDKESAQALEGQIKTLVWDNTDTKVILSESLVEKLINESQKILDKKEE